jgi:GNAT superfamily N-acetyltransferase
MKLTNIFEEMMDGLHFHEVNDSGRMIFMLMNNRTSIGYINIDYIPNGYDKFDEYMDEDEYLQLFRGDSFYEIEHIEVDKKSGNKGYGGKLIKKAIEAVKGKGGKAIYLNASPIKHESLDLDTLVNFYSKFGFKTIVEIESSENNIEMIKRL